MDNIAYVSVGSNVGDSPGYLREALTRLAQIGTPIASSDFYRTKPWGKTDQPEFYNAVAAIDMGQRRDPQRLLYALVAIESDYERTHGDRWGPRTLDLDLLLYNDLVEQSARCEIPHPRLRERAFVLAPLADIAPDLPIPPDGKTAAQIFKDLPEAERASVTRMRGTGELPVPKLIDYDACDGPAVNYARLRPVSDFDRAVFDAVCSAIRFGPRMKILDTGCGTGKFTRLFAERSATVTGIDKSEAMIAQAFEASKTPNPTYLRVDAVESLPGNNWDAITAFFAVQHFSPLERFLLLAKQRITGGGSIAVATFPHRHFIESPFCEFFPSFAGIDMARFPSAPGLVRMMRQAGFANVEQRDVTGEITQDFAALEQLVKNRYLSTFHLLDTAEFETGLAAMRKAWSKKPTITRSLEAVVVSGRRP